MAADDWLTDFALDEQEAELVLYRIRSALRVVPADSVLAVMLKAFEKQVAARDVRLRLPVRSLDLTAKIHLSELWRTLSTDTGQVSCRTCGGAGKVPLPRPLVNLQAVFDYDFNLSQVGQHDRLRHLQESPDPKVRERIAAERQAELERKRDADRRAVERSYGVAPGTPRGVLVGDEA